MTPSCTTRGPDGARKHGISRTGRSRRRPFRDPHHEHAEPGEEDEIAEPETDQEPVDPVDPPRARTERAHPGQHKERDKDRDCHAALLEVARLLARYASWS